MAVVARRKKQFRLPGVPAGWILLVVAALLAVQMAWAYADGRPPEWLPAERSSVPTGSASDHLYGLVPLEVLEGGALSFKTGRTGGHLVPPPRPATSRPVSISAPPGEPGDVVWPSWSLTLVAGTGGANVRSGPSTRHSQLGYLAPGERAEVIGRSGAWWQIEYEGQPAWAVGGDVVIVSGVAGTVP